VGKDDLNNAAEYYKQYKEDLKTRTDTKKTSEKHRSMQIWN
jgi:hypothetical protein